MEEIGNYMLLDETDNSLITEEKLFLLENCARNIRDNLLSLEKTIGAIGNEELKSCISQLKSCFDKFFMKLNNLDSYFEYLQKKRISGCR